MRVIRLTITENLNLTYDSHNYFFSFTHPAMSYAYFFVTKSVTDLEKEILSQNM